MILTSPGQNFMFIFSQIFDLIKLFKNESNLWNQAWSDEQNTWENQIPRMCQPTDAFADLASVLEDGKCSLPSRRTSSSLPPSAVTTLTLDRAHSRWVPAPLPILSLAKVMLGRSFEPSTACHHFFQKIMNFQTLWHLKDFTVIWLEEEDVYLLLVISAQEQKGLNWGSD